MPFPARPRPAKGEATRCYLNRVAWGNGYKSLRLFRDIIPQDTQDPLTWVWDQLNLNTHERQRLLGPLPPEWGKAPMPDSLHLADFNIKHQRWCSLCLQEGSSLHWSTTLKLVSTCIRHGTWLSDTCPRCNRYQPWPMMPPFRCRCGEAWITAQQEAPFIFQKLSLAAANPESVIEIEGISLSGALWTRLIRKMALVIPFNRSHKRKSGQLPNQDVLEVSRNMQTIIITLISEWPSRFHSMLQAIQDSSPPNTSIQKTFGRLYRTLYIDFPEPDFDWLRQGFEGYLNTNWQGLLCIRNRRLQKSTIESHPRVALKKLASQTGIPSRQAARLAQKNILSAASLSLSSKRTAWTACEEDISLIQPQEFLTLREASKFTGIPRDRLRELIKENLLTPTLFWKEEGKTHRSWTFKKSALNQLLINASQKNQPLKDPIDFRRLLQKWQIKTEEFCELVRKIQAGTIACQRNSSGHNLDNEQVREFIRHYRQTDSSADFSVDQAARHLAIKQQVAYDLVKSSLLKSYIDLKKGTRIKPTALIEFTEKYISLSELARIHNTSPKSFLTKNTAQPASGPSIDGSRKYYFLKEDVLNSITPKKSV